MGTAVSNPVQAAQFFLEIVCLNVQCQNTLFVFIVEFLFTAACYSYVFYIKMISDD